MAKLNNKSQIGIYAHKLNPSNYCDMYLHEIGEKGVSRWREIVIPTTFNKYPEQCSVRIEDAWEMNEGSLYLKIETEVDIYSKTRYKEFSS